MLGFTPFKRRANAFNYTPRYYDPAAEARDERRAELTGERRPGVPTDAAGQGEVYSPGQFIRTSAAARADRRAGESRGSGRIWMLVLLGAMVAFLLLFGYPRVVEMLRNRGQKAPVEEFNPYRPITVVPNDYEQ